MEKRKYKLETAGCTSKKGAITALRMCLQSDDEVIKAWASAEITCSPSHPRYREMIEALDLVGVKVFDYDRTQLPTVTEVERDEPAYT